MIKSQPMNIREFQPSDKEAFTACLVQLQDAEREFLPTMADGLDIAEAYLQALLKTGQSQTGKIFVVEVEGTVAGYIAVQAKVPSDLDETPYEYGYISDLVVLDSFRGRGLGIALLKTAETFVRDEGISQLRLSVLAQNTMARQLYERFGFQEWEVVLEKRLD